MERNESTISDPNPPTPIQPTPLSSSRSSSYPDSFYFCLAALTLLLAVLAANSFTNHNPCTIHINGHSTTLTGNCPITTELLTSLHPRLLSFPDSRTN
uniref:Movement protein TGBp3 n=1 Tax=Viola mottle virus TaxID=2931830 RepID=A0A8T9JC30_9VIRU|nr:triple gene block 3 protein [Viola mottle virus]